MSTQDLSGKVALVTGASRGIGAAIADTLAAAGAKVIGTATSESGAATISERLAQWGGEGRALDSAEPETIESLIADIEKAFGKLDILVNNAGITRDNLLMRMKEEEWDDIMQVNVNCVAPGFIDTDMTRALPEETRKTFEAQTSLGRFGEAQDIADAVLFLASDQAKYITGQTLHVNGGMLMP